MLNVVEAGTVEIVSGADGDENVDGCVSGESGRCDAMWACQEWEEFSHLALTISCEGVRGAAA